MKLERICIKLVLFIYFYKNVICFMDKDIVKAYLNEKYLKYGLIFGCLRKTDYRSFLSSLTKYHIVNIININQLKEIGTLNYKHHLGIILDADCKGSKQFIKKCGDEKYFDVRHHWFLLSSNKNVTELFQSTKLYINADINVATPLLNNQSLISITDFYNPYLERNGSFIYTNLGYYTQKDGYNARFKNAKYWIKRNLSGITFNTKIVLRTPFKEKLIDYVKSTDHTQFDKFNRFHHQLHRSCQQYYNYSMNISYTTSWGYIQNNDTKFDGLVGALQKKDADFGTSPIFLRLDRNKVLDYGRAIWDLKCAFIFRNPKAEVSMSVFLEPLSCSIWICTLLAAILCIIILRISLYKEKLTLKDPNVDYSWSYLLISIVGSITQQGLSTAPKLLSGRIVTIFMFLLFLIIYQFYSASLVSTLLLQAVTKINTVYDLLMSNLNVGCEDVIYIQDYFKRTNIQASKQLYLKKIYKPNNKSMFLPVKKGVSLVQKSGFAFHVELDSAYPLIEHTFDLNEICEIREVKMLDTVTVHSNMQKHSPFKDMLEICMHKLFEDGIHSRETSYWKPRRPACINSGNSKSFNVGLDDVYPAFMVFAIGIVLSLIILLIELQFYHYSIKYSKNNNVVLPFIN